MFEPTTLPIPEVLPAIADADGVYAVGPDGYPVATKIQVNLMETKLVYAEDISAGY